MLGLSERCGECSGQDAQVGEALLKLGDPDGQLLGTDFERGQALLDLRSLTRQIVDFGGQVSLKLPSNPPTTQPRPNSSKAAHDGQQRTYHYKHQKGHISHIASHNIMRYRDFTNLRLVLESLPRRGVEQSGSSSGS